MDQIKIGKFIAEERKQKKYTQRELVAILGISDKTTSKWECGNGFPEVSLLLPLCNELGISVNELLSGKRLQDIDYKKKAVENMVNMIKEYEENKKRLILTIITGIIATVSFATLIIIVSVYTKAISVPVKILLVIIALAIFSAGLYIAMQGECTIGYYKCKHCNEHFITTFSEYSRGIHTLRLRKLKCPKCGKKSWCEKVLSKEE